VRLDAKGIGTGQIMAAAKIRFDKKKGQYQIESFGNQYIKATKRTPLEMKTRIGMNSCFVGSSQWVDATFRSNPIALKTKANLSLRLKRPEHYPG
jgi:hypothetical protein